MIVDGEALTFTTFNEKGERMDCDVLFMFEAVDSGNNIIAYTDNTVSEEGDTRVYASIYNPDELEVPDTGEIAKMNLLPIEDPNDWKAINEILVEMAQAAAEYAADESGSNVGDGHVATPEDGEYDVINVHYPND